MPTLIASDGYEYKDFAHRVAGRPLENARNSKVVSLRFHREPEGYIKAWCEGWDGHAPDSKRWLYARASAFAWASAHPEAAVYSQPGCTGGAGVTNPVPAAPAAVHAAD